MRCRHCRLVAPPGGLVCRRCRRRLDDGRRVELSPPRATSRWPACSGREVARRFSQGSSRGLGVALLLAAAVVPGAGQVITGRLQRGLAYLGVVVLLLIAGATAGGAGRGLVGVAAAVHACAFAEVLVIRWRWSPLAFAGLVAATTAGLMLVVYTPLLMTLAIADLDVARLPAWYAVRIEQLDAAGSRLLLVGMGASFVLGSFLLWTLSARRGLR